MNDRLQGRLDRLHPSVKDHIAAKDMEIEQLKTSIAELQGQIEPDPLAPTMVDYFGPLDGQQVPVRMVRFPGPAGKGYKVSLDEHGRGLLIHGDESITVKPSSSNEVFIDLERRI
jgi:hypothetical protein